MIQLAIYCCKAPGQKGVGSYDCYSYEWHRDMPLGMPKFMSTKLVMLPNHLIFCHTHLLLPSIFPGIRVFSKVSTPRIRWPKYWNSSISPSNEYSGLISFRIDGFDLPTVQGPLTSLLQQHSWKVSILWHSAVLMIHTGLWYISTSTVAPLPFSSFQFNPRHLFLKTVRTRLISNSSYSGLFHLQSAYIFWQKWRHTGEQDLSLGWESCRWSCVCLCVCVCTIVHGLVPGLYCKDKQ